MNVYRLAGITIEGTTYRQLKTLSVDPGIEKMINTGGQTDAVFSAIQRQRPMCRFSSANLALFLGIAAENGTAITGTVVAYFAKMSGVGFDYTACFSATFNDGMIALRSASAGHAAEGDAQYEIYATHDGTNAPVIFASGATCPAESAVDAKFTAGPFKIGSTTIETQRVEFDTGFDIGQYGHSGEIYDRGACVLARKPMIRVDTLDLGALATLGAGGAGSAVTMYFRKKTNKGGNVADATAEHVSLVGAAAQVTPGTIEGSEGREATGQVEAQLVYNGTDAIVVVDTTAAVA